MLTAKDMEKINDGKPEEAFFRLFFTRLFDEVRSRVDLTGHTEAELRENLKVALVLHADLESTEPLVAAFVRPVVETAMIKGLERGYFQVKREAVQAALRRK